VLHPNHQYCQDRCGKAEDERQHMPAIAASVIQ
jgi:hypothetical protein